MKKIYSLFALLFLGNLLVEAQPVLNQSDFLPNPTYTQNSYSTSDIPNLSAGAAGVNVTWNYSGITATLDASATIVPLASSPNASDFPTANFVVKYTYDPLENPYYTYLKANSSGVEFLGSGEVDFTDFYLDSSTLFTFPYTYQTVFTDTYQYAEQGSNSQTAIKTYDAYGTLITPFGTYNNVMRQKTVESIAGSDMTSYLYFTANPFKIITEIYFFEAGIDSYNEIIFHVDSNLSVTSNEKQNLLTVFPNPTTATLYLNYFNTAAIDKIRIIDVTGKIVIEKVKNSRQINVENLAAGLYIVEAYSGNNKAQAKFIKK